MRAWVGSPRVRAAGEHAQELAAMLGYRVPSVCRRAGTARRLVPWVEVVRVPIRHRPTDLRTVRHPVPAQPSPAAESDRRSDRDLAFALIGSPGCAQIRVDASPAVSRSEAGQQDQARRVPCRFIPIQGPFTFNGYDRCRDGTREPPETSRAVCRRKLAPQHIGLTDALFSGTQQRDAGVAVQPAPAQLLYQQIDRPGPRRHRHQCSAS